MKKIYCDCGLETEYGICKYNDGTFDINSCCNNGNCVSARNVIYCPFCGEKLK